MLTAGGCLDEAKDKNFNFDNPHDTTPQASDNDETGQITVFFVDADHDVVTLLNATARDEELKDWTLENTDKSKTFSLPTYSLVAGGGVRVHTNDSTGNTGGGDIYATPGDSINWLLADQEVRLSNVTGVLVDSCDRGDTCWP